MDNLEIIIREMSRDDLTDVLRIERELFADPWPEFVFEDDISLDYRHPYVAQLDNIIVGYAILVVSDSMGHITNLAVTRKYQRKSIAKKLISFILGLAAGKMLERLVLEVRLSNQPAIMLYESFGFLPLEIEKDYYQYPIEDCLVMIREFD